MAQGTLKDAIFYASKNPTSDFAKQLATQIKAGTHDTLAQQMGIDLTPVKQSSIGDSPVAPVITPPNLMNNVIKPIGDKLAQGEVNTAKALYERGKNLLADTQESGQADQAKPIIDKVLGATSFAAKRGIETIAGGVGDIFTNMIAPFIPQRVKDVYKEETNIALNDIKTAWNTPGSTPESEAGRQKLLSFISNVTEKAKGNPEATKIITDSLEQALEISTLGAGGAVEAPIKRKVASGLETLVDGVNATRNAAGELIANVKSKVAPALEQRAVNVAQKTAQESIDEVNTILNPSGYFSPTEKALALKQGNIVQKGKGVFAKEVVKPPVTPQTEVIQELVTNGKVSSKNLPSKNIAALNQEARIAESNITELVNTPALNKPFTQNTINNVFEAVVNTAKKDLTFVAKSTEERAYQEVLNVAREEIKKQAYNNAGLRTAIKAFNARMERILGSDIYSGASESVGNARLQAAKDMRTKLNEFLANNLESPTIKKNPVLANTKVVNTMPSSAEYATGKIQGGPLYQAQLRREAQLLNARDEIAFRASKNIDKTKLALWLKNHPVAKRGVYYGGSAIVGGTILQELGF